MTARRRQVALSVLLACACTLLSAGAFADSAGAAAPPCADLKVASVTIKPTDPAQKQLISGQPANIEAKITNAGKCNAGTFVVAFKLSLLSSTAVSESISGLAAGESMIVEMPYDFPTSGKFLAALQVNPSREVSETNYLNDTALRALTVVPATVSFAITHFTVAPSPADPTEAIVQGRPAIATIVVENTGNVTAAPFTVQWTPLAFATPLSQAAAGGLAPGESTIVQLEFVYTATGPVTTTALARSPGLSGPSASAKLEKVVEAPLANIRIAKIESHPALAGSPSTIEVTVENNGNAAAGQFVVEWQPGPSQASEAQQVEGLAEGASTTLTFTNVFAPAGLYKGLVIADSTHQLEELFATEKTVATELEIPAPTIDLAVLGVHTDPTKPTAGSPATVTVTVANLGNAPSPPFVIQWTPSTLFGTPTAQTLAQESASLAPGEEREIPFSFTYAKAGFFHSVAEVNPRHVVTETNFANNTGTRNVSVAP